MSKEKTICDIEFDKWWAVLQVYKFSAESEKIVKETWNKAWKTCGEKVVDVLMEYKYRL